VDGRPERKTNFLLSQAIEILFDEQFVVSGRPQACHCSISIAGAKAEQEGEKMCDPGIVLPRETLRHEIFDGVTAG
jgi:hypothetical protein